MKFHTASISALLAISILPACRGYNGEKAAQQRSEWAESLNDSIARITAQRAQDSLRIEQLRGHIADEIGNFTIVDNPREVEPYYILSAFRSAYPLSSTGIAARIMKSEQLELIAALSGKSFNSIRVEADGESVNSDVVPHDQALNYTANGLTTVSFSGAAADSIADLISRNTAGSITLQYLQNGAPQHSIILSEAQKSWISGTWSVAGAQAETHQLEKQLLLQSRQLEILRITQQREAAKAGTKSKD